MKNSRNVAKRTALALLVVLVAGVACSSDEETPASTGTIDAAEGDGSSGIEIPSPPGQVAKKGARPDDKKNGDHKGKKAGDGDKDPSGSGKSGNGGKQDGKGGSGGSETPSASSKFGGELQKPGGQDPKPSGPAVTVSRVNDAAPDAETRGDTPAYVEITKASITGRSASALFSISFAGDVPNEMPDQDTVTYVSFSVERKGRDSSVNASCEADGWRANVNGGGSFPGNFSIQGKTISMSVPWESLGGKKRFAWRADSSWTRSTTLDTYYSLDSAPNYHDKRYR